MRPDCGVHRVPRSHLGLGRFRRALWFLSDRRPPRTCVYGFILPRASRLLQSATATELPLVHRNDLGPPDVEERLPWGSSPSSRHQPAASTPARDPTPELTFRPRRFARPRRFSPPPALRVCFTPLPRPGFALQGFVPLRGAVRAFARRCPRAVERRDLLGSLTPQAPATPPSTSGPCSPRRVRCR
jgi:hypothetical protein